MKPQETDENQLPPDDGESRREAAWGVRTNRFVRWPALVAVLAAIGLYVTLPNRLYFGSVFLLPVIEFAVFIALLAAHNVEQAGHEWQRATAIALIAVMSAANISSLLLLIHDLLTAAVIHGVRANAANLVLWSAQIWLTNVIVFALWYWELDRGGPVARCLPHHRAPDFLFPQMVNPESAPERWSPSFFDYLYTSFTNAAAFSPTDTMPLTEWAKALFMIQSFASIATAVLVIARIANILP